MSRHRLLKAIGICIAFLLTAGHALASTFAPVLDEFWIIKNSSEIFRDSFNDASVPPSGPDDGEGKSTYSIFGAGGMTSETSGKLTMTPALGDPVTITTTFADLSTNAVRLLATSTSNENFLGEKDSFEIHGLYDMSSIPAISGQSFGIRATDRALVMDNQGDNAYGLFVGVSAVTGKVIVALRSYDFSTDASSVLGTVPIDQYLSEAYQIELILAKNALSDLLTASYSLYDSNGLIVNAGSVAANSLMQIYNGEDFIRGEFTASDRIPAAVPEPATMLLFGTGLAGLAAAGRMKRR